MEFGDVFVLVFGFLAVLGAGAILYSILKPLLFPDT
jgi:hypothetical protein